MGAEQLAIYQAERDKEAVNSISGFMDKLRMQGITQRFMSSGIRSPEQFGQFARANHLSPMEANTLLQLVDSQKTAFTQPAPVMPYASSPSGIFDKRSGNVVHAGPDEYIASSGTIYNKTKGKVAHSDYGAMDYFKTNEDGSIVSRKAYSEAEATLMERAGFQRGSYREKAIGAGSNGGEPNAIKTWITPDGRLFNAPNNVAPPAGSRPYSEASNLEQRMLTAQEISSIRDGRRTARRELDKLKSLPNVDFYKSQKERIPELEAEIKDYNDREKEIMSSGNDMNLPPPTPPPTAPPAELGGIRAADHKGKVITNPETGERRVSDGKTWNEVK